MVVEILGTERTEEAVSHRETMEQRNRSGPEENRFMISEYL